jgi:hypothetical protein
MELSEDTIRAIIPQVIDHPLMQAEIARTVSRKLEVELRMRAEMDYAKHGGDYLLITIDEAVQKYGKENGFTRQDLVEATDKRNVLMINAEEELVREDHVTRWMVNRTPHPYGMTAEQAKENEKWRSTVAVKAAEKRKDRNPATMDPVTKEAADKLMEGEAPVNAVVVATYLGVRIVSVGPLGSNGTIARAGRGMYDPASVRAYKLRRIPKSKEAKAA